MVAVMCKPHRCPHIAMTGNICVYGAPSPFAIEAADVPADTVQEDPTQTSITARKAILDTSPRVCEPSEHGTTRMNRHEAA